jgi:hypothetical protein
MRRLVKLVVLNHRVVSKGKLIGFMDVEGERSGSYWF